jgi:hypothetical protein
LLCFVKVMEELEDKPVDRQNTLMGRSRNVMVFDQVKWTGRDEEKRCSVILGCVLRWGKINEFVITLKFKLIGLMEWGIGRWRILFATEEEVDEIASMKVIEWQSKGGMGIKQFEGSE